MIDVSKCKITRYPAPILKQKTKPIEEIDDNIRELAAKMIEIMVETNGVGLAAPQAAVGVSMFVVSIDGTTENAVAYINPKVEGLGPMVEKEEGCLSLPGMYLKIKRPARCRVEALSINGEPISGEAEGLLAQCLQHEYDHLQGILISDKMNQLAKIRFRKQLKELEERYAEEMGQGD